MVATQQRDFFSTLQENRRFSYEWTKNFFTTHDEYAFFNTVNEYEAFSKKDIQAFVADHLDPLLMSSVTIAPLPEGQEKRWQEMQKREEAFEKTLLEKSQRIKPLETPRAALEMSGPVPLEFTFPKAHKSFVLPNGLHVILHQNKQWPIMNVACYLRDADFLAQAKKGISVKVVMEMLMEGSKKYSKQENDDFFDAHGAKIRFGRTGGFLSLLKTDHADVLRRFYHILTEPAFSVDALAKHKAIDHDQYERQKDDPRKMAINMLKNEVYAGHPYEWTFDDAIAQVDGLSVAKLQQIHGELLAPHNVILSIAGDFDLDTIQQEITTIFGSWPGEKGAWKLHEKHALNSFEGQQIDLAMLRDQAVLLLGRPSPLTVHHPDLVPTQLLNKIVFSSLGSRIYRLREQTGLFYVAGGGWALGAAREHGADMIFVLLNPDNMEKAETFVRRMLNEIGDKGVTHEELESGRQMYMKHLIDAAGTNEAICTSLAKIEIFGLEKDYYDKALARTQKISLEEVNALCAKYFNDEKMVRIRVGRVAKF